MKRLSQWFVVLSLGSTFLSAMLTSGLASGDRARAQAPKGITPKDRTTERKEPAFARAHRPLGGAGGSGAAGALARLLREEQEIGTRLATVSPRQTLQPAAPAGARPTGYRRIQMGAGRLEAGAGAPAQTGAGLAPTPAARLALPAVPGAGHQPAPRARLLLPARPAAIPGSPSSTYAHPADARMVRTLPGVRPALVFPKLVRSREFDSPSPTAPSRPESPASATAEAAEVRLELSARTGSRAPGAALHEFQAWVPRPAGTIRVGADFTPIHLGHLTLINGTGHPVGLALPLTAGDPAPFTRVTPAAEHLETVELDPEREPFFEMISGESIRIAMDTAGESLTYDLTQADGSAFGTLELLFF